MRGATRLLVLAPLVFVSACMMGPDYKRPTVTPPPAFRSAVVTSDHAKSLADLPWFELFKEPELSVLVREALDNNLDLMSALARVEEFRGRASVARAANRPNFDGNFTTSATATGTDFDNTYNTGLLFNWEIDFFGRLRRAAQAASYELLASEEGTRAVMASVATGVAQLYVTLRSLDDQRDITLRTIKSQEEALNLVRLQNKGGVASGTEVQQALTQLATTQSTLPQVERQILQVENQLSVLLGRSPNGIIRGTGPGSLPTVPDIPVGLPSQLLERRPDIRATEASLRAAVARIGVAEASKVFIPRIGLTGFFGRASTSLEDMFAGGDKAENLVSIGPFLQIPLYDGGAGKARVRIFRAQAEQAALDFRRTVLISFREVADALATIQKIREEIAANETRVSAAGEYLRLTDLRYRGGVASYIEVIDAERQLFGAEIDLNNSKRTQLLAVLDLYLALGGGWSDDELKKLGERPMTAMQ